MSSHDQALAAVISQILLAADGALLGITLAAVALRSFQKFAASSSALRRIRGAPAVSVSDLRLILPDADSTSSGGSDAVSETLVVVRGVVEAKSVVDGSSNPPKLLFSSEPTEGAVVLKKTETYIYNEWRGVLGWTSDLRSIIWKSRREQQGSFNIKTIPFILVEDAKWPKSAYVVVNLENSKHHLPLMTDFHRLQQLRASPYTLLQALVGHDFPVGLLEEEKILPIGKKISAVGFFSLKNGIAEIKSSEDLPYFLSDMTKDQMVVDLAFRTKILMWGSILLGSLSVGVIVYAVARNWNRWKQWRQLRRSRRPSRDASVDANPEIGEDDQTGDVPDGELCVICLARRRRAAFVPCGHLVCCYRCGLSVQRDLSPKCPVCRQTIENLVRIFGS